MNYHVIFCLLMSIPYNATCCVTSRQIFLWDWVIRIKVQGCLHLNICSNILKIIFSFKFSKISLKQIAAWILSRKFSVAHSSLVWKIKLSINQALHWIIENKGMPQLGATFTKLFTQNCYDWGRSLTVIYKFHSQVTSINQSYVHFDHWGDLGIVI